MAKKVSEFLKALIVKAGGNPEDEKIKAALALVNADAEVQDDLITSIENGLISIPNAKNNHPEIKNHYFAAAYNGLDSEIDRIMQEEKFSEDLINEIKNEKSSTKRAALLAGKIKELEAAKAGQNKDVTKTLNEKIAQLNEDMRKEKESINNIKADYEKKLRDKDKGYAMRNLLSGYQTIHDKLDPDTKNIIVNAILDKNLKSKGYILDVDENGNLVITTKEGANAFTDDNRPLTPKGFFDKVMADENLLVVSDNQNQNRNNNNNNNSGGNNNRNNNNNNSGHNRQQNQNNNGNNQNQNNNGNGVNRNSVLSDLVKKSQADLEKSNGTSIF